MRRRVVYLGFLAALFGCEKSSDVCQSHADCPEAQFCFGGTCGSECDFHADCPYPLLCTSAGRCERPAGVTGSALTSSNLVICAPSASRPLKFLGSMDGWVEHRTNDSCYTYPPQLSGEYRFNIQDNRGEWGAIWCGLNFGVTVNGTSIATTIDNGLGGRNFSVFTRADGTIAEGTGNRDRCPGATGGTLGGTSGGSSSGSSASTYNLTVCVPRALEPYFTFISSIDDWREHEDWSGTACFTYPSVRPGVYLINAKDREDEWGAIWCGMNFGLEVNGIPIAATQDNGIGGRNFVFRLRDDGLVMSSGGSYDFCSWGTEDLSTFAGTGDEVHIAIVTAVGHVLARAALRIGVRIAVEFTVLKLTDVLGRTQIKVYVDIYRVGSLAGSTNFLVPQNARGLIAAIDQTWVHLVMSCAGESLPPAASLIVGIGRVITRLIIQISRL